MIHFLGTSFAARHLWIAAAERGNKLTTDISQADLIFISEDTPTDEHGNRDLLPIRQLIELVSAYKYKATLVLTSQVPPGFTRSLNIPIYHQAETLRVKDAVERAYSPEQHIVGCLSPSDRLPKAYYDYLLSFQCPIHQVSFEEAELAKIAINMALASQVDYANRLAAAAHKVGANWQHIIPILQADKRIGKYSYLQPGDWKESRHLLRDYVTLKEIENA